jgi:urease accessory protein
MREILILSAGLALVPAAAYAHPGGLGTVGFVDGVLHPLAGPDHLAAALLVGALSGLPRIGARLALAFIGGVAAGLAWGATAQTGAASMELGMIASLAALAAACCRLHIPACLAWLLGGAAGLVHGAAHGLAGPSLSLSFALGVLASMCALVAISRTAQWAWQHRRAK